MGIDNKIVGYVYLVDKNCKVRWAGCGTATDEEVESLRTATAVLLSRSAAQK
jgi:ATPase complex subunit ATP10